MSNSEKTMPRFKNEGSPDGTLVIDKTYLLGIEGPDSGSVFTLTSGSLTLGRDLTADVMVQDTQASRKHAHFVTRDGSTSIEDLGSTNGTFVNGEKISGSHELVEGDLIQLGQNEFRFTILNPVDGGKLGLLTHVYFEKRMSEELDRAQRYKRPLSLLMLSMGTNQSKIREQNEDYLRQQYPKVVNHIRKVIRNMDLLAHYGKFELELLLPETSNEEAVNLAKRIIEGKNFDSHLQLLAGVATYPDDGNYREMLIEKSRQALRKAKENPDTEVGQIKEEVRKIEVSNQEIVIQSEKMVKIFELTQRVAKATITVLILGETGVGKEVIAESIHQHSDRKNEALVCINCAALTETLLESELFGHEKGSFTGADQTKIGLFETARGGTIFLDEVGEMPLKTQAKLLRVLQSKKIMRVGSNKEQDTDVRVVAATNRNLEEQVEKGIFREDLFYRLNAATLTIPPLRERKDEIPYLVDMFSERFCKENGFDKKSMSSDALSLLQKYHWPGNIRELKNVVERAVIISDENTIKPDDLSGKINVGGFSISAPSAQESNSMMAHLDGDTQIGDMKEAVDEYEKNIILQALERTQWNQTKAADMLQVPRRTLVSKIKKYNIKKK